MNTCLWISHWTDPVLCHLLYCRPFYFVSHFWRWVTPTLPRLVLIEMLNNKHQTCWSVCCSCCILENKTFLLHVCLGTEDDFFPMKSTFHWLAVKWKGTYLLPSSLDLCCPQMLVNRFSGCYKSDLFPLHEISQVHLCNSIIPSSFWQM